ncbi:unnamed protein product [Prunus armeniaca]
MSFIGTFLTVNLRINPSHCLLEVAYFPSVAVLAIPISVHIPRPLLHICKLEQFLFAPFALPSPTNKPPVALSTAEAEYVSAAEATSQAKWLRFVLKDFGEEQVEGTTILCDNTSAIAMARNPVHHQKTRHISWKFHFIREAIQAKEIELIYCKTEDQIADIFTKALPKDRFVSLRRLLGVKSAKGLEGSIEM